MAENNVPQSVWEEKDRRIVRQSSLKVAAELVIAADKTRNDIATLSSVTRGIADVLVNWVYEQNDKPTAEPAKSAGVLPTPTAIQKKVLDAIFEKVSLHPDDKEAIQQTVLKWAKEIHGIAKYPENLSSVDEFVKWNNKS